MSKIANWWNNTVKPKLNQFGNWLGEKWNDLTGQTAVSQQNQANLEMARYQAQMQEEFYKKFSSPEAIMRQYREANLNPNLAYGAASGGQGNVPTFSAPQVERSMSGSQKIDRALSAISQGLGLVTGVYQAAAAREAAQQSVIKTMDDSVNLQRNKGNLNYDNLVNGGLFSSMMSPDFRLFRKRNNIDYFSWPTFIGDRYNSLLRYAGAARSKFMNDSLASSLSNIYQYGFSQYGLNDSLHYLDSGILPYQKSLNLSNQLKYQLNRELGNSGIYGKLLISMLGLLK